MIHRYYLISLPKEFSHVGWMKTSEIGPLHLPKLILMCCHILNLKSALLKVVIIE